MTVTTVLYKSILALAVVRSIRILALGVSNCITWVVLYTFVDICHERIWCKCYMYLPVEKTHFSGPVRIPTVKCVINKYSVSASTLVSTDFNQKVKSLRNEVESRGKRRVLRQGHRDTVTSQYPRG